MDINRRLFLLLPSAAVLSGAAAGGVERNAQFIPVDETSLKESRAAAKFIGDEFVRVQDHALYDSVRVPAGKSLPVFLPLFVDSIGCHAIGSWECKTKLDTNLNRGNFLPPPQSQLVERILILFPPSNDSGDNDRFAGSFYWEFLMEDRIVASAPAFRAAVVGDPYDVVSVNKERPYADGGLRTSLAVRAPFCVELTCPVRIESLHHFLFRFSGRAESRFTGWSAPFSDFTPVRDFAVYVFLDGLGTFGVI